MSCCSHFYLTNERSTASQHQGRNLARGPVLEPLHQTGFHPDCRGSSSRYIQMMWLVKKGGADSLAPQNNYNSQLQWGAIYSPHFMNGKKKNEFQRGEVFAQPVNNEWGRDLNPWTPDYWPEVLVPPSFPSRCEKFHSEEFILLSREGVWVFNSF